MKSSKRPHMRPPDIARARLLNGTAAVLTCALACTGCGSPIGPTARAGQSALSTAAPTVDGSQNAAEAAALTPGDFAARGWECRPSPVPGRIVCSRPNQGFPTVPPPADRPPTFTLLVWQDGSFAGTLLLIRPDLYQGQICESTGQPFIFRSVIGYYECLHTVGS